MTFDEQQRHHLRLVEQALDNALPVRNEEWPVEGAPKPLTEAMRYSLLAGGKRLRPVLTLAACEAAGGAAEDALPFAAAVEMIHTYSLIHDDLPAMDNDDLRRGKLTSHKVFGEAMAILAGDALLNLAFETMCASEHPNAFAAMREVGRRSGSSGMIAGQCADIAMEGKQIDTAVLAYIHERKTGDLFKAAVLAGLQIAGASQTQLDLGRQYAQSLGLAFQIVDDILDVTGEKSNMGKTLGKDAAAGKVTWPAAYGLEAARMKAAELIGSAVEKANQLNPEHGFLQELARHTLKRVK